MKKILNKKFLKRIITSGYTIGISASTLAVVLFARSMHTKLLCLVLGILLIIFYTIVEAIADDDF